jgi:hypothetical protein
MGSSNRMKYAGHGERLVIRDPYKIFVGKNKGKRFFGRPRPMRRMQNKFMKLGMGMWIGLI